MKYADSTTQMQRMGSGPRAWPFRPRHIRNSLLFGGVAVASLMLGLAMWQGGAKPAQAATAQATIGVGVRVLQDCSALLDSSTTIIAASLCPSPARAIRQSGFAA